MPKTCSYPFLLLFVGMACVCPLVGVGQDKAASWIDLSSQVDLQNNIVAGNGRRVG